MKIFVDSARLDEIEEAYSCGFLDGVTTNPSLIKKGVAQLKNSGQDIDMVTYIREILTKARGTPVSLEVTEFEYSKMVKQGKKLFDLFNPVAGNVNIKIPVSSSFEGAPVDEYDGLKAIESLSQSGIPVNCTLVFTPEQALMAAKAGATFVSPFAGRVDDYIRTLNGISFEKADYFPAEGMLGEDDEILEDNGIVSGIDLIDQIIEIFREYDLESHVLAASIRNPRQTREAALVGADMATLPFAVIRELVQHLKTREGMDNFTKDIVPEYADLTKE
jgi:transaldolase